MQIVWLVWMWTNWHGGLLIVNQSPKHQYNTGHFWTLKSLYKEYLEHCLGHKIAHSTFKRYLVSRNKRLYCDLFDDYRHGRTKFPSIWSEKITFTFTTHMSNESFWGGVTHLISVSWSVIQGQSNPGCCRSRFKRRYFSLAALHLQFLRYLLY